MDSDMVGLLGVDGEKVRARIAFFESYRETFLHRIPPHEEWVRIGTAATSFRFAAQFAAILDAQRAKDLINEAADYYSVLGLPYGFFLSSCFGRDRDAVEMLFDRAARQLMYIGSRDSDVLLAPRSFERIALTYPVQQTYLLLALSMHRETWMEMRGNLSNLTLSLSAHGAHPMGPYGLPIQLLIGFAQSLQRLHEGDSQARMEAVGEISRMAQAYASAINEAQKNTYLWQKLQSPTDIIDLELVGLTTSVARILTEASLAPLDLQDDEVLRQLPPLAKVPIAVGIEMSEHQQRPTDMEVS